MDTTSINFTKHTTTPEKLREIISFVGAAAKLDAHAIGFLTLAAYEEAHARKKLITLRRNNDLVGFLLFSLNQTRECRILQIWVRNDARLLIHGRMLIDFVDEKVAVPNDCWT
ncbi:MAG: hypothetical protein ACREUY_04325, partial [Burkholderiales bacterium]